MKIGTPHNIQYEFIHNSMGDEVQKFQENIINYHVYKRKKNQNMTHNVSNYIRQEIWKHNDNSEFGPQNMS